MTGKTLTEIFETATKSHAAHSALRWKEGGQWKQFTYAELGERVQQFAWGLLALGVDEGDKVAIFSKNNPQWAITDWAAVTHGFVTVPIYDTLTAEKAAYILADSKARVVVVQTKDHLNKVRSMRKKLPALRHIIVIEEVFEKTLDPDEVLFEDVYKLGSAYAAKHKTELEKLRRKVKPDTVATFIYTSGTTGEPKGAIITHGNIAWNVAAVIDYLGIGENDSNLSFLPLSHVFERVGGHFTFIAGGATISYAESIEKVPENLAEVKPTILISVPRLYEKIYARIQENIRNASWIKRYLFRKAVAVGRKYVHEKYALKVDSPSTTRKYKRYDKLVFSKIRERTGGRVRFAVSGGAPLSPEIHEFFTAAGILLFQGYGLTETPTGISINRWQDFRIGSVGKPLPGVSVKIGDDGEILVKAPMVFQGYFNKTADTKEAFTKDGYFRTGDIGKIDEDGFLFVTDRKKELLVMSNGKKVAPQPIENELKTKPGIGMAALVGDNRPYIVALLSPDLEAIKKYAEAKGIKFGDQAELVTKDEIRALVQESVGKVNENLSQYEKIKKWKVLPSEFTQEGGELTPTLKIKRRILNEKYKNEIQELYADGGRPASTSQN